MFLINNKLSEFKLIKFSASCISKFLQIKFLSLHLVLFLAVGFATLSASLAQAGSVNAFGPETYQRSKGAPVTVTHSFSYSRPGDVCLARVYNGGLEDAEYERVSSSIITFNASEIFVPSEFNQQVSYLEKPVTMAASNQLDVEVRGKPGGALVIIIECDTFDTTPPTITASLDPTANANGWHNSDATVSFTCSDADSDIASCSAPVIVGNEGANQAIIGTAVDAAGNTSSTSISVSLDETTPVIDSTTSVSPNASGWYEADVTVSYSCTDNLSGVATCPPSNTLTTEGNSQHVQAVATDNADNTAVLNLSLNIDKFSPVINATISPLANAKGWHNADVTISFDCADSGSGVAICTPPLIISTEGQSQAVEGSATDISGKTTTTSLALSIDKTPPTIEVTPSTSANASGWHNTDVSVSFNCDDTLSGVNSCSSAQTLSTEGASQTIIGSATDNADNSATTTISLNIDKSLPTISAQLNSPPNANGWHTGEVTVTFICDDAVSGIADCPLPITLATEGANQTVSGTATDNAGNSASTSITINVDNNLPTITATLSSLANAAGWHNADVTVTFDCQDTGSGVASCSEPVVVDTDGAMQMVIGEAIDLSGNVATTSVAINLDKTTPTLAVSRLPLTGTNGWNDTTVTLSYTCTDVTSGVDSCPDTLSISTEGQQEISQSIIDRAGNTTSVTTAVAIDTSDPTIMASLVPGPNGAGWSNTDVTIHFDCADAISGVAQCSQPVTLTSEGSAQLVTGVVTDVAGRSVATSTTINIDKTAPVIFITTPGSNASIDAVKIPLSGQVSDGNAITSLTINGASVALANNLFTSEVGLNVGLNTFELVATDIANNQSTTHLDVFRGSQNAPSVTSLPITDAVENENYQYQVIAEDADIGDVMQHDLVNAPQGMTIDIASGLVNWVVDERYASSNIRLNTSCVNPNIPQSVSVESMVKWHWGSSTATTDTVQVMSTPAVAQVNDDNGDGRINQNDIPDIIFTTFANNLYNDRATIRAISGKDGSNIMGSAFRGSAYPGLAVGDLDNNGIVEIVVPGRNQTGLLVLGHNGFIKWEISSFAVSGISNAPAIVDVDNDGTAEIVYGKRVINGDGTIRWDHGSDERFPVVADMDMDGDAEIFSSGTLYDHNGNIVWSTGLPLINGAVGNFDNDDFPEIVAQHHTSVDETQLYILNHDGSVHAGPFLSPSAGGGPIAIADVDADGQAEIGMASKSAYIVFEADGSIKWTSPTQDASGATGSSMFDFDGDGKPEILYADGINFRIYNGETGEVRFTLPNSSGTLNEFPIVADIDNDNHAEIILVSNNYTRNGTAGIRALQGANDDWMPTRKIWNQHAYHITNINDNGRIPRYEQASWLMHNTYRASALTSPETPYKADLAVSDISISRFEAGLSISAVVINRGLISTNLPVSVNFYNGNPDTGGTLLGATDTAWLSSGEQEQVSISNISANTVLNEIHVIVDQANQQLECIEENNSVTVPVVRVNVQDAEGLSDTQVYALNVADQNTPPQITSIPDVEATAGSAYQYQVQAADDNVGDAVLFELTSSAPGIKINPYSGLMTWTPSINDTGNHTVSVRVSDLAGESETQSFTLSVGNNNTCSVANEVIRPISMSQWTAESVRTRTPLPPVWEVDASGSIATQFADSSPSSFLSGADYTTQHLRGTFSVDALNNTGAIGITFGYQDNHHYYYLQWNNNNDGTGSLQIQRVNNNLDYPWDGLDLLYNNQNLVWQPQVTYHYDFAFTMGGFSIVIKQGSTILDSITVADATYNAGRFGFLNVNQPLAQYTANTVQSPCVKDGENHLPKFISEPVINGDERATYQYQTAAIDADLGDTITYTLVNAPQGMFIDSQTGLITWNTPVTASSAYHISVRAEDNNGGYTSQNYLLSIRGLNSAPVITTNPTTVAVLADEYIYQLNATDADNEQITFSLSQAPQGMTIQPDTGLIRWLPAADQVGQHSVIVTATDVLGAVGTQSFSIDVTTGICAVTDEIVTPVKLTSWVVENVPGSAGDAPLWQLENSDYVAHQFKNSLATNLLSPIDLSAHHMRGTLLVTDVNDDDAIGITFGYQDANHYYFLSWRNQRGLGSIAINRVNNDLLNPWNGLETLYVKNGVPWQRNIIYTYDFEFNDNGFNLVLKQGDTLVENITIADTTFTAGRFGFHGASQSDVLYTANTVQTPCVKQGQNHIPEIVSVPLIKSDATTAYHYQVAAIDPDVNDVITYSLHQAPTGMAIDGVTGLLTWDLPEVSAAPYTITIRAEDSFGDFGAQTYYLSVNAPNNKPVIVSTPVNHATAYLQYRYDVDAIDADGDPLVYEFATIPPAGMVIDSATGLITWTPDDTQLGQNEAWVKVNDGREVVIHGIVMYVSPSTNTAPSIVSIPAPSYAVEGQLYNYDVNAIDSDGDALSYSITTAPAGMSIIPDTGLISWTPGIGLAGSYNVTILVDDARGGTAIQSYTVTVLTEAPNEPPQITSTPTTTAKSGYEYSYQLVATDADNDALSYSFTNAPVGMTISPAGLIRWTATLDDIASHTVAAGVTDGQDVVTQSWGLNVIDGSVPLSATLVVNPTSVNEGDIVTIVANAQNAAGEVIRAASVDGVPVTLDTNGMAQIVAQGIGAHEVIASVSDVSGTTQTTATFFVKDPNDTTLPVVDITSPDGDITITSLVGITGSVTEANLAHYALAYAPAGSDNFITLAEGSNAFPEQTIATFDATQLRNGLYTIVLQATDQSGQTSSDSIQVLVDGNLKVGNFSFTVVDLEIPVSGIPIRVTRTYDSRRRHEDLDFGYGWSIGYQDVKLEESRTPGQGWALNQYPSGPLGLIPLWCVEPLGNLRVSVTLPDGEVESFKVQATPSCAQSTPVLDVRLNFVPEAGTLGTLAAQSDPLLRLINGNLEFLGDGVPYDTDRYVYTSKEGFEYHLDQNIGIEMVKDLNGNTLTYTDNGIIHSDGKSVLFNRDGLGRITSITDPMNNVMQYDYDGEGNLQAYTDLESHTTTYTYVDGQQFPNLAHSLLDIIDPLGRGVIKNIYDNDGRLIAQEDANGVRTEFDHNIEGRESVVTNRRGYITRYFYDDRGNVTVTVDADGATVFEYDADDNLLSTMNPLGEMSTASYDDRRNQLTQTNDLGHTVRFDYNQRGQETKIFDARGNVPFENSYDALGNLRQVKDPEGNIATQTPNAKGLIESRVDALLGETLMTYDNLGNKRTETDAEGNVTSFTYDDNSNIKTETRQRTVDGIVVDEVTQFEYDNLNRLINTTDPLNQVTHIEYDEAGNESARIDAKGQRTQFEYDAYRRLLNTTYPDNSTEQNQYDAEGNLILSIDRVSQVTQYRYDALNRQTRVIYHDGTFTETQYDAAGRVIAEIDERGNRTEHQYDRAGRRILSRNADLKETTFEYDEDGNLLSQTDAKQHTTTFEYDALDRRTKTIFHDNSEMLENYDVLGRLTLKTDQSGISTQYGYDKLGRLTSVISAEQTALATTTRYEYDEVGNKRQQMDANLNTTTWTYDELGRVKTRTLPEGQQESFAYDVNGNQEHHIDFNNHQTRFDYDSNDRLIMVTYHDGSTEEYTYYDNGQRHSATDARGTTTYTYDDRDRLTTETQPDGTVLSYDYDAAGNRTLLQTVIPNAQSGTTDTTATQYSYDNLNRLHTVTDHHQQQTAYTYDEVGNRASVTYHNGTSTLYVYDSLNRLETMQTVDGSNTIISQFDYTVYPTGHRHTMTDLAGNVSTYHYDDLYRLTQESINHTLLGAVINSHDYDAVGNRQSSTENGVTTTYTYDNNDRMLTSLSNGITTIYTYDNNGNAISQVDNSASTDTSNFSYDARNKLIFVEQLQNGIPSNSIDYQYDVDGNRTQKADNSAITNYVVDRNQRFAQVVHEMDVQNATQVTYTYGDDLISQDRAANISYYHYDGLGSTRSLTDFLGQVTDTYDYNAYGTMLDQSGTTDNSYLYTGEQFDSALDNYYLRARYYDPANGRFTAMDSWLGEDNRPLSLNKYNYTESDPINGVDPSGLFTFNEAQATANLIGVLAVLQVSSGPQFKIGFSASDFDGSDLTDKQAGLLALKQMDPKAGLKLQNLVDKKEPENQTRSKPRKDCPTVAPFGPYYRYESEAKWVIQTLTTGFVFGKTPKNGGAWPTVQAYRTDIQPVHPYKIAFCTPIKPEPSGPVVHWYYPKTQGVILHDPDTAKIPVVVIDTSIQ